MVYENLSFSAKLTPMTIPLIDAHLDLSWNALAFDRDQTLPIAALRKREAEGAMTGRSRARNTVSLPEMRRGGVGVCLATVLARALPAHCDDLSKTNVSPIVMRTLQPTPLREHLDYANQEICSAVARGQAAYYQLLEKRGEVRQIRDRKTLKATWAAWSKARTAGARAKLPVGYILSMEGADPILDPQDAQWWWEQGLRTVCLAHYGQSAYAMGTGGDGPLTRRGRDLVKKLDKLGMIIDLVHTADTALSQILDLYGRGVFVSHGNCRALVPGDRQISDGQIKQIAARGGVIGLVMDCWMLTPGWKHSGVGNPSVTLATVADHVDHLCQVTGSVDHAAIGSDLDGGFGTEQSPSDLGTIAGLQKLAPILRKRGYSDAEVKKVFHGNWLRFFGEALPV
jgi:membrane dipeptidase